MKRPASATVQTAIDEVRAIYDELATRPVERACRRRTDCCRFKLTGRTPQLTRGEAVVVARALRATGRTTLPRREDGACPLLDDSGACMVYEARPFGCRTHFCAPAGGDHPRRDVVDLIHRLDALDAALGGDGASTLPTAVGRALRRKR